MTSVEGGDRAKMSIAVLTAAIARPDSAACKATADEPPAVLAEDRVLIADRNP